MANRFDALIDKWDAELRKAFIESIRNIRDAAQIEQIIRMLERNDLEGAVRAIGLDPVAFRPFDKAVTAAFEAGGEVTALLVPTKRLEEGLRVIFQFNIRNPDAEAWLSQRSSTQITQILDDQRILIREHLRAGMERGLNPRSVALDLVGRIGANGQREGGAIGLTSIQDQWARNYADELASDNPLKALERLLRDKRFDAAVKRAAASGQPIPAELRQKMIAAYRNRALRYRAEAIARTEAMAALHEAQQQAIEQAVASGSITKAQVGFVWRTAHDNRVRESHQSMDGDVVKLGEKFVTGNGNYLEFPGDPNGPVEDIINCRCWREPAINFLAGLR